MPINSPTAESLAEELLGRKFDDLGEEEQRVLARVASGEIEDCDADDAAGLAGGIDDSSCNADMFRRGRGHCGRGRGRHREGHPESSREGQHRDHHVRGFCGEQHEAAEADRADYQAGEHGGERAPPGDGTAAQR